SKTSIMPSVATRRWDTKAPSTLKRNTPGRWPIEQPHTCPPQGVHSTREGQFSSPLDDQARGSDDPRNDREGKDIGVCGDGERDRYCENGAGPQRGPIACNGRGHVQRNQGLLYINWNWRFPCHVKQQKKERVQEISAATQHSGSHEQSRTAAQCQQAEH